MDWALSHVNCVHDPSTTLVVIPSKSVARIDGPLRGRAALNAARDVLAAADNSKRVAWQADGIQNRTLHGATHAPLHILAHATFGLGLRLRDYGDVRDAGNVTQVHAGGDFGVELFIDVGRADIRDDRATGRALQTGALLNCSKDLAHFSIG